MRNWQTNSNLSQRLQPTMKVNQVMSKMFLLLCTLGFFALLPYASACSCHRRHEQHSFCSGDHAMEFLVTKVTQGQVKGGHFMETRKSSSVDVGDYYFNLINQHQITDLKIYQNSSSLPLISKFSYVYSLVDRGVCGVTLSAGHRYAVIGAYLWDSIVQISYCLNIIDLGDYPADHVAIVRSNLASVYSRGCECNISYCGMVFQYMEPCFTNTTMKCERAQLSSSRLPFGEACIPYRSSDGTRKCTWF